MAPLKPLVLLLVGGKESLSSLLLPEIAVFFFFWTFLSTFYHLLSSVLLQPPPEMSPPVLVLTDLGRLRGARRRTCGPRRAKIFSFRRIPYAAPPLGNLRLAPPRPPQPWQGTLDCAGGECTPCLQVSYRTRQNQKCYILPYRTFSIL